MPPRKPPPTAPRQLNLSLPPDAGAALLFLRSRRVDVPALLRAALLSEAARQRSIPPGPF